MMTLQEHIQATMALARLGIGWVLDIILHVGAHRTGSTSFQNMLRCTAPDLRKQGVAVWETKHTRDGRFAGLVCPKSQITDKTKSAAMKSTTHIQFELDRLDGDGVKTLVVSEENMLGQMRCNLAAHELYPDARFCLGWFSDVFGDRVSRVVLAVRSQDAVWRSALSYGLNAGLDLVAGTDFDALANAKRRWRHVVSDMSRAFGSTKLAVWKFEAFAGDADGQLAIVLGGKSPAKARLLQNQHHASPNAVALRKRAVERGLWNLAKTIPEFPAQWQPFNTTQLAGFQAAYAKDLDWLSRQPARELEYYGTKIEDKNGICIQSNPQENLHRGSFDDKRGQRMG